LVHHADFMRANDKALLLSRENKGAEARAVSAGEAREAFDAMAEHLTIAKGMANSLLAKQSTESEAQYTRARWWMLAISVLGLGLSFAFSLFMVQQTIRRLHQVSDYLKDVAEGDGDLTKRIKVDGNDELDSLGGYFNAFMEKLHDIISQVAASTEHIASASEEISSSATQVAQSAETQKDETSQVATAMQ